MKIRNILFCLSLGILFTILTGYSPANLDPGQNAGGGLTYSEFDPDGTLIRHVVSLKIMVVTGSSAPKNIFASSKNHDVISRFQTSDVDKIRKVMHKTFNGPEGTGAFNLQGERVFFDFQVEEYHIAPHLPLTEIDLVRIGNKEGPESGAFAFRIDGKPVYYRSSLNFMICRTLVDQKGKNNGVITCIRDADRYNPEVYLHETLHQLLTRGSVVEHKLGGGLATPPDQLTPVNVSAVLEDALLAKNNKRIIMRNK